MTTNKQRNRNRCGCCNNHGSTVRDFVNDEKQFKKSVDERFAALDSTTMVFFPGQNCAKLFKSMRLIETHFWVDVATTSEQLTHLYHSVFDKFDIHSSGTIDLEDFRSELKIMLAIADGLGFHRIQMALEDGNQNFLKQAANLEASKINKVNPFRYLSIESHSLFAFSL